MLDGFPCGPPTVFIVTSLRELMGGGHRAGGVDQMNTERKFDWTVRSEQSDLMLDLVGDRNPGRVDQAHLGDLTTGILDPSPRPEPVLKKLTSQIHPRASGEERMTATASDRINSPTIRTRLGCPPRPRPPALLRMARTHTREIPEPLAATVLDPMEDDRIGGQSHGFRLTGRTSLK